MLTKWNERERNETILYGLSALRFILFRRIRTLEMDIECNRVYLFAYDSSSYGKEDEENQLKTIYSVTRLYLLDFVFRCGRSRYIRVCRFTLLFTFHEVDYLVGLPGQHMDTNSMRTVSVNRIASVPNSIAEWKFHPRTIGFSLYNLRRFIMFDAKPAQQRFSNSLIEWLAEK